jgi:glutamate/tyrosine decarboxylase-like PLP-dependent enzyme
VDRSIKQRKMDDLSHGGSVMSRVCDTEIGGGRRSSHISEGAVTSDRWKMREEGRPWSEIQSDLMARKRDDCDWRAGRLPLYVYHESEELLRVSREAYALYFSENALGGRAFPSLVAMENEIVGMALGLFEAPEGSGGSFTSGGTESIFLALKTARDHFRARHPSGIRPAITLPRTAHPAFDKAAQYLDIDARRVAVTDNLRVDVSEVCDAIDNRTMMIVGSAPCYPYGVFDCIEALSEIALARQLWLHVDACLGGFLAPFARELGYPIPQFDFRIRGVTSISADLHKYGFSAKGASVLLYRSADLLTHQRFLFDAWPRGTYATDTFLGTRPGGAVASAWAVSHYLGKSGYRDLARKTMEAKERLMTGVEKIPGLEVIRPSELCILLYRSIDRDVDIHAVAEVLGERGWFVGRCREPEAVHFALNPVHGPITDQYLNDLAEAVKKVRASRRRGARDDRTY